MEKFKIQLNFGSIAGLGAFVLFVVLYLLGYNPLGPVNSLGFWIPILFIYKGVKKYRNIEAAGYITYGKAFFIGIFISFVYASLFSILIYLFGYFIDGSFIEMVRDETIANADDFAKIFGEEYAEQMIEEGKNMNELDVVRGYFISKLIWASIVSLIIAGILKKTKSPFEESAHAEQN